MKKFCVKNSFKYNAGEMKALQWLNSQAACGSDTLFSH